MKTHTLLLATAILSGIFIAPAISVRALPGQSQAQLAAWMKSNPALASYATSRDEMSAGTLYHTTVRGNGVTFTFEAIVGNGVKSYNEMLSVLYTSDSYDLRSHRPIAVSMIRTIYGNDVADDFASAPMVGDFGMFKSKQRNLILRGTLFGYSISGPTLTVFPANGILQAVKQARICAMRECGG